MLYLDDLFVWDFWLAPRLDASEPFHCYFLQAPRSLPDPEMRHDRARIGHATSANLIDWDYHGTILPLGERGEWDDWTQWTGSVTRHDGNNSLFYTGRSRSESSNVQRIGLAVSDDLYHWTKSPNNPLVQAVAPWYEAPDPDGSKRSDCRDPWIIRFDNRWLMYYTASAAGGRPDRYGVVGLAISDDLLHWTPAPPVAAPGVFGEIEVPQVFPLGKRWVMLFCTAKHAIFDGKRATWNGTHYMLAESPYGPFELAPEPLLLADEAGSNYAARAILDPWLGTFIMAFQRLDANGRFVGALTNPIPLILDEQHARITVASSLGDR
jgi:beta-fructofuranosidase